MSDTYEMAMWKRLYNVFLTIGNLSFCIVVYCLSLSVGIYAAYML